ncbi:MAG: hypothetical protein WAP03_19970 [Methylorubrum rhodinum]|uniref:hypothetical protein n=1 Tax=Methylorubrum rhodinum TaxID=29428 RepID=UPI003BAFD41E
MPARKLALLAAAAGLSLIATGAQAEPPIRSAEDAFCRSEARAQVFSAPDPLNLGLHEIGRRIWASCMQRKAAGPAKKSQRRRRHR